MKMKKTGRWINRPTLIFNVHHTIPVCQRAVDVVFLVEDSNFILAEHWDEQLQFVSNIINQFDQNARFAVVTFNEVGKSEVFLHESIDRAYLHRKVTSSFTYSLSLMFHIFSS